MNSIRRAALGVTLAAALLLGTAGASAAVQPLPPIDTDTAALAALTQAQADVDSAQARITAVQEFLRTRPTTPPTTTVPAPTTTVPPAPASTEAAVLRGWGTPLPASDEFNYTGRPDGAKWSQAGQCWAGHAGNGRRCADRSNVAGGMLTQTGLANGDTGWLASKLDQRYGRWEARVRSSDTGTAAARFHPLQIIWPQSNRWPQDGEYDFLENDAPGQACAESFIHYPHPAGQPVQQEFKRETNCGAPLTEWHNVAFEWTAAGVAGFIDGREWFRYSGGAGPAGRSAIQAMPSGHLTIQLDGFAGTGPYRPARYDVDFVRIYRAP